MPTVKDRFIQQAIHQELSRYYEPYFSEHSYGFRPNRNAGQAILQATTYIREGKEWVVDKSIERLKDKVREITKRVRGVKFSQVIKELNVVIIGWTNYFRLANKWLSTIRDLDGWIRRKLRVYKLKQCGGKYTIYKLLRNLGMPLNKSWNAVMYSQGWWHMSKKEAVNQAMNLKWFAQQGLQSLLLRMKV